MSKVYDGIIGLVVGDALGVPVEFKKRDTFKITDMIGYEVWNQPPGTWSDDSSLTLATLDALVMHKGKINLRSIMLNFSYWYSENKFTPHGECFDTGRTTRNAINNFIDGVDLSKCGGYEVSDNGNGSLMRILPLAFIPNVIMEDIFDVSSLTHGHYIAQDCCLFYIYLARCLLNNIPFLKALNTTRKLMVNIDIPELNRLNNIECLNREDIKSSGYVVDTLESAIWCLANTDNYKDCVLKAVNLGGDTDTIAAVAGGLAGIMYGSENIPSDWINVIPQKDKIENLCERMEKYRLEESE